jgi:hypothetical protein
MDNVVKYPIEEAFNLRTEVRTLPQNLVNISMQVGRKGGKKEGREEGRFDRWIDGCSEGSSCLKALQPYIPMSRSFEKFHNNRCSYIDPF